MKENEDNWENFWQETGEDINIIPCVEVGGTTEFFRTEYLPEERAADFYALWRYDNGEKNE